MRDIVECELTEGESPVSLEEKQFEVIIRTAECGRNQGRSCIYRSEYQDTVDWEAAIDKALSAVMLSLLHRCHSSLPE